MQGDVDRSCFWCCHQVGGLPGFGGPGGVDLGDESRGDSWDHHGWPHEEGPNGSSGHGDYPTQIYPEKGPYPHGKGGKGGGGGGYHRPTSYSGDMGHTPHHSGPHPPPPKSYGKGKGKGRPKGMLGGGFGWDGPAAKKTSSGKPSWKASSKRSGGMAASYPTGLSASGGRRLKTRRSKHASSSAASAAASGGRRKPASVDVDVEDFIMTERELNHVCHECLYSDSTHCYIETSQEQPTNVPPGSGLCPSTETLEPCVSEGDTLNLVYGDHSNDDGSAVMVDIADAATGACGVKAEAASHTQVAFYLEVTYDPSLIQSDGVTEHLQQEMGPKAICSALDDGLRRRKLQQTDVVGYEPCGPDYEPYGDLCQSTESGIICERFKGQVCIYCDPSLSTPECYAAGLGLISDNAAKTADPPRITGVKFIGGYMSSDLTDSSGMDVLGNGGGNDAGASSVIVESRGDDDSSGGNALGIALGVGLGLCALIVAFLAVRKNRKSSSRDVSFLDDEDFYGDNDKVHLDPGDSSFDGTEVMSDNGSPLSWRKTRPGHVVGEDDSVIAGGSGIPRDLMMSEEFRQAAANDLARSGSGVDVHQCNSAMCEICLSQGRNPRFVPSTLRDIEIEAADNSLNSSGLSDANRSYPMEDTVDF